MPLTQETKKGSQPQPTGHPLPRRSSPENSITLRHHRLARDASRRVIPGPMGPKQVNPESPRRNSSGESQDTGQSDPKNWFDQSNENPTATFDNSVMEVDPPFFQKETDSSNEDKSFAFNQRLAPPQLTRAQSSSADDYRSVIDDLTVEIKRLKEELKRYKQPGPDMLRKEKLFEIKVHGLPKKKKRELEATLRDFAASLQGSPDASSSQRKKKSSRRLGNDHGYSGSGSLSKHASSSSGSNVRPADSAYASMSTGAKSTGTSLGRPMMNSKDANEKKVENYLRDIPEGLYPRHMIMTDKERRKLVVRRLEQLFTGKFGGRHSKQKQSAQCKLELQATKSVQVPAAMDVQFQPPITTRQSSDDSHEPAREAKILPLEQQSGSGKKSRSRDNGSMSNSHGDGTESGGHGNSTGSDPSPPTRPLPEQRPTRPRDLDPDRVQVPSENMDYIRHLGLIPPELLETQQDPDDVRPDEDGWVYLNLLCNLAQLHIINVTPDFVRSAVSGMSTKFQLSSDGRKIRWRGGTEGTKFSSDSSGYNSQKSPSTDDSDNPKQISHKRQKTGRGIGTTILSGHSSKDTSKFGQNASSSESFHYKPIFAQRGDSSNGLTSVDDTLSSFGPAEESNFADSRWDMSGSGVSNRRKRRHDGAIIYYSGAPFCTDLSGDPGELSPSSHMLTSSQNMQDLPQADLPHFPPKRTSSGSFINYRPLSDRGQFLVADSAMDMDGDEEVPSLTADDTDNSSDAELDLTWSDEKQCIKLHPLEPCGLGGVLPDDHFVVVVTTKRPKHDIGLSSQPHQRLKLEESTDAIIRRLATMSTTGSPLLRASKPLPHTDPRPFEIEYLSGGIKRLAPVPLPPPALFFPPFSTDDSSNDDIMSTSEDMIDSESSKEFMSQRANPHQSDDYPDGVDLSSGDEEGDDPDEFPEDHDMYDISGGNAQPLPRRGRSSPLRRTSSAAAAAGTAGGGSKSTSAERMLPGDDSSAATAGGAESGSSSSEQGSD